MHKTTWKRLRRKTFNILCSITPRTRAGDRFLSFIDYVACHRRLPSRRRGALNDVLYFRKVSAKITDPLCSYVCDKEYAKDYFATKVGREFVVPTIAVLCTPEDVRKFDFPANCVVKPTHLSGHVIIRQNNAPIDHNRIAAWFRSNLYFYTREITHRYLTPKVIVEPILFEGQPCHDYKFFCVDGRVRMIQVDQGRHSNHQRNYYLPSWDSLPFSIKIKPGPLVEKPAHLSNMIKLAETLSKPFPFIRVDLYTDDKEVKIGELTHFHENCAGRFIPLSGEAQATKILFGM